MGAKCESNFLDECNVVVATGTRCVQKGVSGDFCDYSILFTQELFCPWEGKGHLTTISNLFSECRLWYKSVRSTVLRAQKHAQTPDPSDTREWRVCPTQGKIRLNQ